MDDVKQFCEKYLENYTINIDDTIDVYGHVNLGSKLGNIQKLPVKFRKVSSYFSCYDNNLTSLEGCPDYVGWNFYCVENNLTSLEGCPKYIGGSFYCSKNRSLVSLKGIEKVEIIGSLFCKYNQCITSENYKYILDATIGENIETGYKEVDEILNTYKNDIRNLTNVISALKKVRI
jgi:hypothetical protein